MQRDEGGREGEGEGEEGGSGSAAGAESPAPELALESPSDDPSGSSALEQAGAEATVASLVGQAEYGGVDIEGAKDLEGDRKEAWQAWSGQGHTLGSTGKFAVVINSSKEAEAKLRAMAAAERRLGGRSRSDKQRCSTCRWTERGRPGWQQRLRSGSRRAPGEAGRAGNAAAARGSSDVRQGSSTGGSAG
eukprot:750072-Hanusia_phi.AAC.5